MINGTKITLGGTEYIVPPLNFKALKTLQPMIESLSKIDMAMSNEQIDNVAEIVLAALNRNYPDKTKDDVLEWLDLGNSGQILGAIMGASGIKTAPVGEQVADSQS